MKISDTLKTAGLGSITPEKPKNPTANVDNNVDNGFADKVTLSSQPAELKKLAAENENDPFDAQKVEAIKQAIMNGEFKVDTNKVADGLIDSVKDMLGTRKA